MRSRIIALSGGLLLLAGLLGFVLIRYAVLSRGRPSEWRTIREVPNTDVNPFGADFFLAQEVEPWKRERTVELAQQAGLGWAKQQFAWAEIEALRKGEFIDPVSRESSWAKFDQIVDLYRAHGLRVIARLDRTPAWARPADTRAETPPTDFQNYGDFVYAFVQHFRGRVEYIQIWNEPNIYPEWGEQAVDPQAYTQMLKIAYQRAKEADPNVHVLSAPLAVTLGEPHPEAGRWRSMPDLDYLDAMYEAGASAYFDILSANAFGFDLPPSDRPDPGVLNFRRVELQREIMEQHGDSGKAIWFNEYGWNAAPAEFSDEALIWKRVSEEQQAEYTLQGIEFARTEWPWAGVFNIWYFRQTGQQYSPDEAAHYFRMVDVDFTPRRLYDAVQDATDALLIATSGHFEETNPAVSVDPAWSGAVAIEASGQGLVQSNVPESSLAFAFQGRSVDLIAMRGPEGCRLFVTLDGRNVAGLPTDSRGRSYLDLSAQTTAWRARLPIAQGLSAGQHVVRFTVGDEGAGICNVDALEVNAASPPAFPTWPVAGLGLALLAAGAALIWDLRRRPRRERFF